MLIGWRPGRPPGSGRWASASRRLRIGARAIGCLATILMAIVGCATVTDGTPVADTAMAPAYRTSVSASISASAATSSMRESQRQQSLTTQAAVRACESFATSSKDAVDKVNDFVAAYNQGRDTTPSEGPAIDTLNHSAEMVEGNSGGPLSQELHQALNAYADAARDLANAIRTHREMAEFNDRVNQFNDTKTEAVKLCRASI